MEQKTPQEPLCTVVGCSIHFRRFLMPAFPWGCWGSIALPPPLSLSCSWLRLYIVVRPMQLLALLCGVCCSLFQAGFGRVRVVQVPGGCSWAPCSRLAVDLTGACTRWAAVLSQSLWNRLNCSGGVSCDSTHLLWRNVGCLLWIKDMVAVSSHHVTLWQLPDVLSNSVSHLLLHPLSAEETGTTWQLGDGRCMTVVSGKRRVHLVAFVVSRF